MIEKGVSPQLSTIIKNWGLAFKYFNKRGVQPQHLGFQRDRAFKIDNSLPFLLTMTEKAYK